VAADVGERKAMIERSAQFGSMIRLRAWLVGLGCIGLLAGSGRPQPAEQPASNPEVKIEVFSDFQCPYCKQFAPTISELNRTGVAGVKTKVEFRNFPLGFHKFAQLAAQAAMAAREQGKFWEMHDLLFANQKALGREDLLKYAQSLNLDMDRFTRDMDGEAVKKIIEADKAEGEARKVEGTPTFFVNGKEYTGTKPLAELSSLITRDVGSRIALAEINDSSMNKGPANAPVKIEFFADLESPVSRAANYVLEELIAKYPSDVQVQFRNFPLSFHPQAELAHVAALAAGREGHFWEMANYVFDHQESVREQDLIAFAGRLGMDQTKFAVTLKQRRYVPKVEADIADGFQRGVHGSPVMFVNDHRVDGVPSFATLKQYVDDALSKRNATVAKKE
jgi:protein-disulfide isomerase